MAKKKGRGKDGFQTDAITTSITVQSGDAQSKEFRAPDHVITIQGGTVEVGLLEDIRVKLILTPLGNEFATYEVKKTSLGYRTSAVSALKMTFYDSSNSVVGAVRIPGELMCSCSMKREPASYIIPVSNIFSSATKVEFSTTGGAWMACP